MSATSGTQPILALDLSTKTGWALGVSADLPVKHGVWTLPPTGASMGERLSALDNKLADAIAVFQPRRVFYEAPVPKQQTSALLLISLAGIVEKVCWELGIPVRSERPDSVRKVVLGKARFWEPERGKHGQKVSANKSAVVEWAIGRGYDPADDNAADALALLHFGFSVEMVRRRYPNAHYEPRN